MQKESNKLVVILGPTSSGKSDVAVRLAKKFNGEIISADSRQIYRGMDIGSGKVETNRPAEIPQEFANSKFCAGSRRIKPFFSEGIPHYGIDIISPRTDFNAAKFKKYADKAIADILKRGKLPIICGGTGFWIKAVVDNVVYPEVKPDPVLRNTLRNKTTEELFNILKKLDPERAKNIDAKNPVRLIRAIEICKAIGKVPRPMQNYESNTNLQTLQIGIALPTEKLHENIHNRLRHRFDAGMVEEVRKLHFEDKISWKKLESFGLGYRLIPQYLKGEIKNETELFEKIFQVEKDYAKRQMTWFKKDKRIVWKEKYQEIKKEAIKFLK
jgi:tRNA dimethylallyltransferase